MPNSPISPFPLYLLPSIPFRRRRSSATTVSTSLSSSPPTPTSFLSRAPAAHLRCQKCLTDLIPTSSIISKGFTGRHGRAYLVAAPPPSSISRGEVSAWAKGDLPNTFTHKPVPRQLVTGAHTVSDISCRSCGSVLGWKYVDAAEEAQKYKVGKFILETKRVVKGVAWEDRDDENDNGRAAAEGEGVLGEGAEEVEFDSQDEDECEDLFSGIWSPALAMGRRRKRGVGLFRRGE